jgi:glycine/D-amino acid oxidase-like deaminating enzyme
MKAGRADFVVVGAGVFGVWTAHFLRRRGYTVTLLDAHGAGNTRSSSGDESRIIRIGYGADTLYTRWAARSLQLWQEFFRSTGQELFVKTGVLWLGTGTDLYTHQLLETLVAERLACKKLSLSEIANRFPQIGLDRVSFGVFEPDSGILLARRSVQAVLDDAVRSGVHYLVDAIVPPVSGGARLEDLRTRSGQHIRGDTFIFACGAWLPQIFPELLGTRIFPTRQEVFFFGTPAGARQFRPPIMPVWLHHQDDMYGLPDIENRGVKVASDRHGELFEPESGNRTVGERGLREVRAYLRCRLPELKESPLLETRVCQYENTSNGDFLIDRHPEIENIWLVGGGSGHGFKHAPAMGQHVAARILDGTKPEKRFSIESKLQVQDRTVY